MTTASSKEEHEAVDNAEIPRRILALITYLHPFRLIESDEKWNPTIEQINKGGWDYVKLHEIVGGIDVGLEPPYHLVVGFDGALALPPIPELRSIEKAVEFFNRSLASILLGGIYCEAVTLDSVEPGWIFDWKYIRASGNAPSFVNQFHRTARMKMTSPIHAIELLSPRRLAMTDLISAAKKGNQILEKIPEVRPEFLLKGTTSLARHDWGSALANLWIIVEQLTSHLWTRELLAGANRDGQIVGRKEQLTDNRTWTTANKLEVLYQRGNISTECLQSLFTGRKARNDLVHQGKHPTKKTAYCVFSAIRELLDVSVHSKDIPLFKLNIEDHALSDPFQPRELGPIEPQYSIEMPKLPGEAEYEREEAQKRMSKSN